MFVNFIILKLPQQNLNNISFNIILNILYFNALQAAWIMAPRASILMTFERII